MTESASARGDHAARSGAAASLDELPAKAKKGRKAADPENAPLGSAKAVETMFRNATRTELDLIALAAAKANIMISLNGFIISALMISGAFLFNSSPSFLVPAAVFMLTSAGSIAFALLAASPERVKFVDSVRDWARAVRGRRAGMRDLRRYVMRGGERDARQEDLNLLIYEDRVLIDPDDYWDRMQALLRDRDEIYHQMSDQLYWLGETANRKFKLLNISYSVFRWGLVAAMAAFLVLKSALWAFPGLGDQDAARPATMGIEEFTDIYEPSAVQQLPDGRILVVEDEPTRAMNILTIEKDGRLSEDSAADLKLTRGFGRTLSDLEGLSIDDQEFVYAITSHSGDKNGARDPEREQLLRFKVAGNQVGEISSFTGLRDHLGRDRRLRAAIVEQAGVEPDIDSLNIEGLAFHRETQHLLLGLREPMAGGLSVIVVIENPGDVFARRAEPRYGAPILLDLDGGGIRALSYDPVLQSFVIVNEVDGPNGDPVSQMWSWSGTATEAPGRIRLPNLINLDNVESIDSITVGGEERLLIMSDEGDPEENIPAKYLMLEYADLPAAEPSDGASRRTPTTTRGRAG